MRGAWPVRRPRRGLIVAGRGAFALTAAVLAGCSSMPSMPSMGSFSSMFGTSPAAEAQASVQAGPVAAEIECPEVEVRQGASTYSLSANPSASNAMNLRYQATIAQTARECRVNGNTVTIRVGIIGRVILGPSGTPGQIVIPVRMAVVREGPEPRPITTNLQRVPVSVPADQGNVQFTHVEENLSFPMPPPDELSKYVVYVGFDPLAAEERKRPERKPPPKAKPRRAN